MSRRPCLRAGLVALAAGLSGLCAGTTPAGGQSATPDPCAALRCPDLELRPPYALHLLRLGSRTVLAATNAIVNTGDGPLELRGTRIGRSGRMAARQVLRGRPGTAPAVLPGAGTIEYFDTGSRGVYWKYEQAARFELWRLDAAGDPLLQQRVGPKLDYCFRDLTRVRTRSRTSFRGSPARAVYGACDQRPGIRTARLGTSVGWADIYPWRYPLNWVDVSGLAGCFLYVMRADPENHIKELDELNNAGSRVVRLPYRGAGRRGCPAPRTIPGP